MNIDFKKLEKPTVNNHIMNYPVKKLKEPLVWEKEKNQILPLEIEINQVLKHII